MTSILRWSYHMTGQRGVQVFLFLAPDTCHKELENCLVAIDTFFRVFQGHRNILAKTFAAQTDQVRSRFHFIDVGMKIR